MKYIFYYSDKWLETDSLAEVRSDISTTEWDEMVNTLVRWYCVSKAMAKINEANLPAEDAKFIKRLKKTLNEIQRLDGLAFAKYDLETMVNEAYNEAQQVYSMMDDVEQAQKAVQGSERITGSSNAQILKVSSI